MIKVLSTHNTVPFQNGMMLKISAVRMFVDKNKKSKSFVTKRFFQRRPFFFLPRIFFYSRKTPGFCDKCCPGDLAHPAWQICRQIYFAQLPQLIFIINCKATKVVSYFYNVSVLYRMNVCVNCTGIDLCTSVIWK